jgi:hypothetical protein
MALTPGTIGILTGRGPACDALQAWLDQLPPPPFIERLRVPGNQIAWQRDYVVGQLRPQDTWLLFVDADMVPPHGALDRLLSHELPLVGGACLERVEPFDLCAVKQLEPYERYRAADVAGKGEPFPVLSVGTGFLLIRRPVLAALGRPAFRIHPCGAPAMAALLAEDLDFCLRAGEAGFPPYLDPAVRVGHQVSVVLTPGEDGRIQAQWPTYTGLAPHRRALPLWED